MEAYHRKDFKSACPYFEQHTNDPQYGNGNDGYTKAISCYYHWAREDEAKWENVAALWGKVKTRCQSTMPCSITAALLQQAASDMADATKSAREIRKKAADSSGSVQDYTKFTAGALQRLAKTRAALNTLADSLKLSKIGLPTDVAGRIQAKIDALRKEIVDLKKKEAARQDEIKALGNDRDAWKKQALQAAEEANTWQRKYYDLLHDVKK